MPSYTPRLGLSGIGGIGQMAPGSTGTLTRALRGGGGSVGGGKKRRKKKAAGVRRAVKKAKRVGAKLKKGSAAAKAYMAKIRKMRKK